MLRRFPCCAAVTAALLSTQAALADRVAVLPARGGTDDAARSAAQVEIVRGLAALGHTSVPEGDVSGSLWAVTDGVPDSADEYRTVGAATKADWVLVGLIEPAAQTTRVELIAFQAKTGRVESVAREVVRDQAGPQIQEMLGVLVRQEGIGTGDLPWERVAVPEPQPQPQAQPQPQPQPLMVPGPPPSEEPKEEWPRKKIVRMDYMTTRHNVWPPYSAGNPLMLAVTQGFTVAAIRPEGAAGSSVAYVGSARLGYAVGEHGVELLGQVGGNLVGPSAIWIDAGARVLLTPSVHPVGDSYSGISIHFGVEALVGAFIRPGSSTEGPGGAVFERSTEAGVSFGAAGLVAFGVTPGLQLEAQLGNLRFVTSGEGALLLVGATCGAGLRF